MATAAPPPILARRLPASRLELFNRKNIGFHHPGYGVPNLMLTMARVDTTTSNHYGVYHRTALLACQIVANNIFDRGRFALDREGQQRVQVPLDGVLTDDKYFFIVDGTGKCLIALLTILATTCRSLFRCAKLSRLAVSAWPSPRILA
jgi:hypothetical protein